MEIDNMLTCQAHCYKVDKIGKGQARSGLLRNVMNAMAKDKRLKIASILEDSS